MLEINSNISKYTIFNISYEDIIYRIQYRSKIKSTVNEIYTYYIFDLTLKLYSLSIFKIYNYIEKSTKKDSRTKEICIILNSF